MRAGTASAGSGWLAHHANGAARIGEQAAASDSAADWSRRAQASVIHPIKLKLPTATARAVSQRNTRRAGTMASPLPIDISTYYLTTSSTRTEPSTWSIRRPACGQQFGIYRLWIFGQLRASIPLHEPMSAGIGRMPAAWLEKQLKWRSALKATLGGLRQPLQFAP
jgi:hypothetical protein